jgi:hypothetical protein
MKYQKFTKDPNAVLDYATDWAGLTNGSGLTNWLEEDEIITAATVTAETGLTVNSSGIAAGGTKVVAWLSSGTVGETYKVVYHITTSLGRQDDRTIVIEVAQK